MYTIIKLSKPNLVHIDHNHDTLLYINCKITGNLESIMKAGLKSIIRIEIGKKLEGLARVS